MRFQEFRQKFKDFIVFSLDDIRKADLRFHRRRLNDWQNKGYLKKLRRGYYLFSETPLNEKALHLIADRLYSPSYISFETALSWYGLIPEGVYSVTAASSRKTSSFKTPIGNFLYQRIRPDLFFGYRLEKYHEQGYKIAEMEKALLDYLYFHPKISDEADFHEWRFNSQEFLAKANMEKLQNYAKAFQNKRFLARLEKLLIMIQIAK
ncbi:MAG: hypothetical protein V1821_02795 [bacterium]